MDRSSSLAKGMYMRGRFVWGLCAGFLVAGLSSCELFIRDPDGSGGSGSTGSDEPGATGSNGLGTNGSSGRGGMGNVTNSAVSSIEFDACVTHTVGDAGLGCTTGDAGFGCTAVDDGYFYIGAVFKDFHFNTYDLYAAKVRFPDCVAAWENGTVLSPVGTTSVTAANDDVSVESYVPLDMLVGGKSTKVSLQTLGCTAVGDARSSVPGPNGVKFDMSFDFDGGCVRLANGVPITPHTVALVVGGGPILENARN
jgi:hypothetical protein